MLTFRDEVGDVEEDELVGEEVKILDVAVVEIVLVEEELADVVMEEVLVVEEDEDVKLALPMA